MSTNRSGKVLIVLCLTSGSVCAAVTTAAHATDSLEEVVVTASGKQLDKTAQPVTILDETALQQTSGSTLGEILETLPGISNASFGAGVGRPIVRGLAGNRVKIAVNGNDAADVSAMSNDHAPMADTANADQVEVIYGPNTLLFGSGAIGGVINVVDKRVHKAPLLDESGEATWQSQVSQSFASVSSGTETSASIDVGLGSNWVLHADGFLREDEDYDSPVGSVDNTQTEGMGFNTSLSHIRNDGHSALALSVLDYDYGVPNLGNQSASVTPYQVRLDGDYEVFVDSAWLESFNLKLSAIDYEHEEIAGDVIAGYFEKENVELKSIFSLAHGLTTKSKVGLHVNWQELRLCHDHSGCDDGIPDYSSLTWDGTKGGNFSVIEDENGVALEFPHDTPMPVSTTRDVAGFWILSRDWAAGVQEYAIRADHRIIKLDPVSIRPASREARSYYKDRDYLLLTVSGGWTWQLGEQQYGLSLSRSERAPQADEMFWNGDHHATFSYQLDNPDLKKETAYTVDMTWRYNTAEHQVNAAVYYYDYDGFIYNKLQSVKDPFHGSDVYQHIQEDAYLTGFEVGWQYQLAESLALSTALDKVIGRLKQGDNRNLPRIPPLTALVGLSWSQGAWLIKGDVRLFTEQNDTGENELPTEAYETLNALVSYRWPLDSMHVQAQLKATNITDELGRNHVSYLKAFSPVPGRNVSMDLVLSF